MKEKKVRIKGIDMYLLKREIELPLSELYAQLKEQGIDPERPFCECEDKYQQTYNSLFNKGKLVCAKCHKPIKPAECEHEWDFSGKWICTKCKEVRSSQPQKPKIEPLNLIFLVDNFDCKIATKVDEIISAVNGLYERFDRASEVIKRSEKKDLIKSQFPKGKVEEWDDIFDD